MEKVGVFKIKTSFLVSGRGIVAVGTIADGKVVIGSTANIEIDGRRTTVKIKGVERGNIDSDGTLPFGLLLSFNDEAMQQIAEVIKLKEQTIDILAK